MLSCLKAAIHAFGLDFIFVIPLQPLLYQIGIRSIGTFHGVLDEGESPVFGIDNGAKR